MGNLHKLESKIVDLLYKNSYSLPRDVEKALKKAIEKEKGIGLMVMKDVIDNIEIAKKNKIPLCQDTGMLIFFVCYPKKYSRQQLKKIIQRATEKAIKKVPLRQNSIDSLTGKILKNSIPEIFFEEWENNHLKIILMLKGGGSENMGKLYSLPDENLKAGRDLHGVRKCILDAVLKAQGNWCPPGIIGAAIGGSRDAVTKESKKQLLRNISDKNKNPILRKFEQELLKDINKLRIGPNGLGGKTTALAVKIASLPRHPASFFLDVSFLCWNARKGELKF